MSKRSRNGKGEPAKTVASLLGSDDPVRQAALTESLIDTAMNVEISFTILFTPRSGQYQVAHTRNARYSDLKAALDAAQEYLTEQRVRAQIEQQAQRTDVPTVPTVPVEFDAPADEAVTLNDITLSEAGAVVAVEVEPVTP